MGLNAWRIQSAIMTLAPLRASAGIIVHLQDQTEMRQRCAIE